MDLPSTAIEDIAPIFELLSSNFRLKKELSLLSRLNLFLFSPLFVLFPHRSKVITSTGENRIPSSTAKKK